MSKANHDYKCQECGKVATKSVGDVWNSWDIDTDGNFVINKTWDGDTDEFYCDKCFEEK